MTPTEVIRHGREISQAVFAGEDNGKRVEVGAGFEFFFFFFSLDMAIVLSEVG